jgi:hypothetical protein
MTEGGIFQGDLLVATEHENEQSKRQEEVRSTRGDHCAAISLGWHLLRSLFMSQTALKRKIAKMRRQIAELKAEDARADSKSKEKDRS